MDAGILDGHPSAALRCDATVAAPTLPKVTAPARATHTPPLPTPRPMLSAPTGVEDRHASRLLSAWNPLLQRKNFAVANRQLLPARRRVSVTHYERSLAGDGRLSHYNWQSLWHRSNRIREGILRKRSLYVLLAYWDKRERGLCSLCVNVCGSYVHSRRRKTADRGLR